MLVVPDLSNEIDLNVIDPFKVGMQFYWGQFENKQDFKKAFLYFLVADHRKDARATYMIGQMYENGEYLMRSFHNASIFYENAAKQKFYQAFPKLIWIYSFASIDLSPNLNKSIYWGEKGLELGFNLLHIELGKLYLYKLKKFNKALEHFQQAFYTHDISMGAEYIAEMYQHGLGVVKNKKLSQNFRSRSSSSHIKSILNTAANSTQIE